MHHVMISVQDGGDEATEECVTVPEVDCRDEYKSKKSRGWSLAGEQEMLIGSDTASPQLFPLSHETSC